MKKLVVLMEQGFMPIPRMEFEPVTQEQWHMENGRCHRQITIVIDHLPVEAIAQVAEYQDKFDRLGVVRGAKKHRRRDPFLIGIIKYGQMEEHFILGWWRPDIMRPTELW